MITEKLYKLDLIKETGVLHGGLLQKDTTKKELKYIKKRARQEK